MTLCCLPVKNWTEYLYQIFFFGTGGGLGGSSTVNMFTCRTLATNQPVISNHCCMLCLVIKVYILQSLQSHFAMMAQQNVLITICVQTLDWTGSVHQWDMNSQLKCVAVFHILSLTHLSLVQCRVCIWVALHMIARECCKKTNPTLVRFTSLSLNDFKNWGQ